MSRRVHRTSHLNDARLAWRLSSPALAAILLTAAFPIAWTFWESLHRHDLRFPWLGQPFVGLDNYRDALANLRFWSALLHTVIFTTLTVTLELLFGLALALGLDAAQRGRGAMRALTLLPWAIPTVVAGLIWRFLFEAPAGPVDTWLLRAGIIDAPVTWLAGPVTAWLPIVAADVWKTAPFMALLLLAGLQGIDRSVYEAARLDGARHLRMLIYVTLPLLRPAIAAAVIFRSLDAFRVFDVVYVITGGGPGTATEPLSLYAFSTFFRSLRFGYGSALSMLMFLVSFTLALVWIRFSRTTEPA
jgi:ABC-type sugar transport system permease subunit